MIRDPGPLEAGGIPSVARTPSRMPPFGHGQPKSTNAYETFRHRNVGDALLLW